VDSRTRRVATDGVLTVAIEWTNLVSRTLDNICWPKLADRAIDPYIVWADATEFSSFDAAFKRANEDPRDALTDRIVPILFELVWPESGAEVTHASAAFTSLHASLAAAPVSVTKHFRTARVPLWALKYLFDPDLQKLIPRAELGVPTRTPDNYRAIADLLSQPSSTDPSQVPVAYAAVIDDGCAFANAAFVVDRTYEKPKSRFHRLWFQEDLRLFGKGIGFSSSDIEAFLQDGWTAHRIDEAKCYASMDEYLQSVPGGRAIARDWRRQMRSPATHGTHVLDVMAGAPNPLAHPRYGYGERKDPATGAKLIFVQLPRAVVADTSGASMNVHVADALAYIRSVVHQQDQVVVNMSYGALAGPHDGSTLLESAIDEFLANHQHFRKMVLPAGNGYDSRTHARIDASSDGSWREIRLQLLPDDPTDTFVEIWYEPSPSSAGGATAVIDLEIRAPDGSSSGVVAAGEFKELPSLACGKLPRAAIIHLRHPIAGDRKKRQALLALAATRTADTRRDVAPHGVWAVRIRNRGGLTVPVDAWIERDDSPFGSGRSRSQATFLSAGTEPAPAAPHAATYPISRQACLNSFAHGKRTTVVGGCALRPVQLAKYSASGPGRRGPDIGPNIVAPCEDTPGSGLLAAGTRSAMAVYMNGTSVASAAAARQYLNEVAACRKLPKPDGKVLLPKPNRHPEPIDYPDPKLRRGRGLLKPLR
jgi:Subtilase family